MKVNVGKIDRIIRILLAAVISTLYITGIISGTIAVIVLFLGGILLLTGLVNFCPLYALLKINSCPKK
jgi:hypothetical protein